MRQTKEARHGPVRIVYHRAGSGPAICLLPSIGRGAGDFHALEAALVARGYRVILPEPRGIGGSEGPLDGSDLHDLAADVTAVVVAEGGRAVVAGHAYGCGVARTLAQDRPDLVRGLALIATGAGRWPAHLSEAIDTLAGTAADRETRLAALRVAFFAPGNDPTPWLDGWHAGIVAAQRAARARTDDATWRPSGTAPILDLVAARDPFRPPASREDYIRALGDRVTLALVDGASHALPDERPAEVAERLDAWIAALP